MSLRCITHKASVRYGLRYGPGQMATAGNPLPNRFNPPLPSSGISIGCTTMFNEQQSTTRLKHTLRLRQRGVRVLHRTQREGCDNAVEAVVCERKRFCDAGNEVCCHPFAFQRQFCAGKQFSRWVYAGQRTHIVTVIIIEIRRAAAQLQNIAGSERHHLGSVMHHRRLRTCATD